MSSFSLRIWTGPHTKVVASRLRAAKVHIAFQGETHLFVHGEGSNVDVARARMVEDLNLMFTPLRLNPRKA